MLCKNFAAIAATIDWAHPPEWSDKELQRILGRGKRRAGRVDVLAKVRLLDGGEQWILLHLEIQSNREADFEYRIARYHSGLFWHFDKRVVTLVVLADLDEQWRPSEHSFLVADFEYRLKFPTSKLIDKLNSEWRDDQSLPVQVARAQIAALRTASDPEGRFLAKRQLVRNLYGCGYNAEELRGIFRLIDWMLALPEELDIKFERELAVLEEGLNMPYVTSVERIAEARGEARGVALGEARGRAQGAATVVLTLLDQTCGPVPGDVEVRVQRLSIEQLAALGKAVLYFKSPQDVQHWLDANE